MPAKVSELIEQLKLDIDETLSEIAEAAYGEEEEEMPEDEDMMEEGMELSDEELEEEDLMGLMDPMPSKKKRK